MGIRQKRLTYFIQETGKVEGNNPNSKLWGKNKKNGAFFQENFLGVTGYDISIYTSTKISVFEVYMGNVCQWKTKIASLPWRYPFNLPAVARFAVGLALVVW